MERRCLGQPDPSGRSQRHTCSRSQGQAVFRAREQMALRVLQRPVLPDSCRPESVLEGRGHDPERDRRAAHGAPDVVKHAVQRRRPQSGGGGLRHPGRQFDALRGPYLDLPLQAQRSIRHPDDDVRIPRHGSRRSVPHRRDQGDPRSSNRLTGGDTSSGCDVRTPSGRDAGGQSELDRRARGGQDPAAGRRPRPGDGSASRADVLRIGAGDGIRRRVQPLPGGGHPDPASSGGIRAGRQTGRVSVGALSLQLRVPERIPGLRDAGRDRDRRADGAKRIPPYEFHGDRVRQGRPARGERGDARPECACCL